MTQTDELEAEVLELLERISTDIAQSILEQPLETNDGRFFVGLDTRYKLQLMIEKLRQGVRRRNIPRPDRQAER